MAFYLPTTLSLSSLSLSPSTKLSPPTNNNKTTSFTPIRCGPRSTRGPLLKGRTLSSEAILAVQSLKRLHRSNDSSFSLLSRLIKSDLVAAFNELLRQDRPLLALQAFSALRSDHHSLDPTAYADLISALARHKMWDDIDRLIDDIEGSDCPGEGRRRGMVRVVKAVIGAGRGESTVRIYRMMKRGGWGGSGGHPTDQDEYLGRLFQRAFTRFGEKELAQEVDDLFRVWFLGKTEGLFID